MRHPNKHIADAIQYAASRGWRVELSKGHNWGFLLCPRYGQGGGCEIAVFSTPKVPENRAGTSEKESIDVPTGKGVDMDKEYEFTLILDGIPSLTPEILDAFYEAGCDDGLLSRSDGVVSIDFGRTAPSREDAILSAIHDIEKANVRRTGQTCRVRSNRSRRLARRVRHCA